MACDHDVPGCDCAGARDAEIRRLRAEVARLKGETRDDSYDGFDEFWSVFPKKAGKKEARRAYARLSRRDKAAATAGAATYAEAVAGKDPAYTKHAQGWLNGRRWEDEIVRPQPARSTFALPRRHWSDPDAPEWAREAGLRLLRRDEGQTEAEIKNLFRWQNGEEFSLALPPHIRS